VASENVEMVRRIYEALLRDDLEAALELIDPDVEYVNPDYAVDSGVRRGHAGIRANVENMRKAFEQWRFQPEEYVEAGDQVIVVGAFSARGRDSGIEIERRMSRLWTIRDGRIIRYQWFDNEGEAFEVAGSPPAARSFTRGRASARRGGGSRLR
jgi:ketosteroid isomerase-like protein